MASIIRRRATFRDEYDGFMLGGFPLVEFDRKPIDAFPLRGFALAWNHELTLIQVLNDDFFRLNGYAVLRNLDVRRWRTFPKDDFRARAVHLQRVHPLSPGGVRIGSMREALSSAGAAFPLITIHRERIKKRVCFVGKFLGASRRTLTIREISPQAEWEQQEDYTIRDITLLEFGGEYEKLLSKMAR